MRVFKLSFLGLPERGKSSWLNRTLEIYMTIEAVYCNACGNVLEENTATDQKEHAPCPRCGSTLRRYDVNLNVKMHARAGFGMRHKRPGEKRPLSESLNKPEYSTKHKKVIEKTRLIDRKNKRYQETIRDYESGEIYHHCDEPLDKHLGHGSAKKRK